VSATAEYDGASTDTPRSTVQSPTHSVASAAGSNSRPRTRTARSSEPAQNPWGKNPIVVEVEPYRLYRSTDIDEAGRHWERVAPERLGYDVEFVFTNDASYPDVRVIFIDPASDVCGTVSACSIDTLERRDAYSISVLGTRRTLVPPRIYIYADGSAHYGDLAIREFGIVLGAFDCDERSTDAATKPECESRP